MKNKFVDYYQLLEIHMFASNEAIKTSYKRLAVLHHPDNNGDKDMFLQIQEAYKVLLDTKRRNVYFEIWKTNYLTMHDYCKYPFEKSPYDLVFQPLRETVHEYMYYIMNNEYEKAYDLLSQKNTAKIFKKDFVKWQQLIGEVHEIISFDSSVNAIEYKESLLDHESIGNAIVTFTIKVKEYNLLLSCIEEDFFKRMIIYENHEWKILLHEIKIRQVIKKYKSIVTVHKKKMKHKDSKKNLKENYLTKKLSFESFIYNVEYEFLRYKRYKREFSIMSLSLKEPKNGSIVEVSKILEKYTREIDTYCVYNSTSLLLLLPETDIIATVGVKNKISTYMNTEIMLNMKIEFMMIDETIESVKEIINIFIIKD